MSDILGEQLSGWGKVAILESRGRRTGRPIEVAVGFLEAADGTLLVAATSPDADWVQNLRADPVCRVRIGARTLRCEADELDGPEHSGAVIGLILKYGTPSESLGSGPAFRLLPIAAGPD